MALLGRARISTLLTVGTGNGRKSSEEGIFAQAYPAIPHWVEEQGWVEIGMDEYSTSPVRALDACGLVWEINDEEETVDEALPE